MDIGLLTKLQSRYKMGASLRRLSKEFSMPKSTIYYNLSKRGAVRHQKRILSLKNKNEYALGFLIGFWCGDGSKFKDKGYTIKFHMNKKDEYISNFLLFVLKKLLEIKPKLYYEEGRANVKLSSKFLYYLIDEYVKYDEYKSKSISLKNRIKNYSNSFLKGFLLGAVLSDGYLKDTFVFSSISKEFINNVKNIIIRLGFKTYCYREKNRSWNDVFRLKIERRETSRMKSVLNNVTKKTGYLKNLYTIG
jgi:hypothetical protein